MSFPFLLSLVLSTSTSTLSHLLVTYCLFSMSQEFLRNQITAISAQETFPCPKPKNQTAVPLDLKKQGPCGSPDKAVRSLCYRAKEKRTGFPELNSDPSRTNQLCDQRYFAWATLNSSTKHLPQEITTKMRGENEEKYHQ